MRLKKINAVIFEDEIGNKVGVEISVKDFEYLIGKLEDLHDLTKAYEITSKKFKAIPYEDVREELFGGKK